MLSVGASDSLAGLEASRPGEASAGGDGRCTDSSEVVDEGLRLVFGPLHDGGLSVLLGSVARLVVS